MKQVVLTFAFVFGTFIAAVAQEKKGFQLGGGIRISFTPAIFLDQFNIGIGPELQGEYKFSGKFSGLLSTGYHSFFGNEYTILNTRVKVGNYVFIPVCAGARFYPWKEIFLGLQVGVGIITHNDPNSTGFCWQLQSGYNHRKFQVVFNLINNSMTDGAVIYPGFAFIYKFSSQKK